MVPRRSLPNVTVLTPTASDNPVVPVEDVILTTEDEITRTTTIKPKIEIRTLTITLNKIKNRSDNKSLTLAHQDTITRDKILCK